MAASEALTAPAAVPMVIIAPWLPGVAESKQRRAEHSLAATPEGSVKPNGSKFLPLQPSISTVKALSPVSETEFTSSGRSPVLLTYAKSLRAHGRASSGGSGRSKPSGPLASNAG